VAGTEHLNDALPRTSKALNATFVAKKEFADHCDHDAGAVVARIEID
jgi:hypothetical protein